MVEERYICYTVNIKCSTHLSLLFSLNGTMWFLGARTENYSYIFNDGINGVFPCRCQNRCHDILLVFAKVISIFLHKYEIRISIFADAVS